MIHLVIRSERLINHPKVIGGAELYVSRDQSFGAELG